MKEHNIRLMVNELRDTAIKYHNHDSLRQRILGIVQYYLNIDEQQEKAKLLAKEIKELKSEKLSKKSRKYNSYCDDVTCDRCISQIDFEG